MLSSEAKNPNCMYKWMNHIVSPQGERRGGRVVRGGTGEREVVCRDRGEDHCDTFHADDEEYFDKVAYWTTPTSDCGDDRGADCKDYSEWVKAWTEIKG